MHPFMRNRPLIRIQILLLVVLVGLVVWRMTSGPKLMEGFVRIAAVDTGKLYSESFELGAPGMVRISATGAFETDESGAPLAVYGWIVNASTGAPAWIMEDFRVEREGVLAVATDSLVLPAGRYDAWFTTLGPTPNSRGQAAFLGLKPHWTSYESRFFMTLSANENVPVRVVKNATDTDATSAFWATGPVPNRKDFSVMVRVIEEAAFKVHAEGEVCSATCDQARIVKLGTEEVLWELDMEHSEAAGGWEANRKFDGTVTLEPGVYRMEFDANRSHGWNGWSANPPLDPRAWGLTVGVPERGSMTFFDPWRDDAPILSMVDVESAESRRVQFEVSQPVRVLVDATGEISTGGTLYDFGQIVREDSGERVWRMSWDASEPAGGSETNRRETAVLDLSPGSYAAYYETDDSHAFNDWRRNSPTHADRWGLAMFLLEGDASSILIVGRSEDWRVSQNITEGTSVSPVVTDSESVILAQRETGNDVTFEESFTLDAPGSLRIVAMGEISTNGRYDYGWLERVDSGEIIWEMTLQNTIHAGGDDRNRRFDGVIDVPAGTYSVHYVSDFGYAFNDFGETTPANASDWGITIFRE